MVSADLKIQMMIPASAGNQAANAAEGRHQPAHDEAGRLLRRCCSRSQRPAPLRGQKTRAANTVKNTASPPPPRPDPNTGEHMSRRWPSVHRPGPTRNEDLRRHAGRSPPAKSTITIKQDCSKACSPPTPPRPTTRRDPEPAFPRPVTATLHEHSPPPPANPRPQIYKRARAQSISAFSRYDDNSRRTSVRTHAIFTRTVLSPAEEMPPRKRASDICERARPSRILPATTAPQVLE